MQLYFLNIDVNQKCSFLRKQECISVGCIPPVLMDVYWRTAQGVGLPGGEGWGCLPGDVCLGVRRGSATPVWTDACENITLPQTLFADGKNVLDIAGCS